MRTGRGGWSGAWGLVAVALALCAAPASAVDARSGNLLLHFEVGPAFYRYEETGEAEFEGLETEWADVAVRVAQETRYRTPWNLVPLLRFSFLTSAEDSETNNVGSPPTDLRVAYFFTLQPGAQYVFEPLPWLSIAPEFVWDLDWYLQVRDTRGAGDVDESVFWHGPAPGFETVVTPCERWSLILGYRHSFLLDVDVSNSFAEDLGFDDFSTDGHRDVFDLRARRAFGRWGFGVGYRFESSRIDASGTKTQTRIGPGGVQTVQIQFPENEHLIHAVMVGFDVAF